MSDDKNTNQKSHFDEDDYDALDGRRARSERSRQKIVEAVLKLVRGGEIRPSAQMVADLAKVSLRTVYRHFEDMESLFKEISMACEATFMPIFMQPYQSAHWKDRLRENLDRRMQVFEDIMYLRMSTSSRRYQSDVLMQDHNRYVQMELLAIETLVPPDLKKDIAFVFALDIAMCFESYMRLRQERGHSPARARDVIAQMVNNILRDAED